MCPRDERGRGDHGDRRDGKGSQDHAADVAPSTRAHEGEQRRKRARDAQNDERAADRGGPGERGERSGGERLLGAGSRILPVLRQLLDGGAGHDEGHPRAQDEQRSGPRSLVGRHAVAREPGGAETLTRPRPGDVEPRPPGHATAARRLGDQLLELLAVACPPRRGIPAQQPVGSPAGVHAVPPAVAIRLLRASREVPSSTIARSSASVASSASAPAGLSRYGRFLPTGPTASIRPRSSRRPIAPYSVPGPSRTPAKRLDVLLQGVPVLGARREAGQDQRGRIVPARGAALVRISHGPRLLRTTIYRKTDYLNVT